MAGDSSKTDQFEQSRHAADIRFQRAQQDRARPGEDDPAALKQRIAELERQVSDLQRKATADHKPKHTDSQVLAMIEAKFDEFNIVGASGTKVSGRGKQWTIG